MSDNFPTVTIENKLQVPFIVYDSYKAADAVADSPTAVFGTLTEVATLQPGTSQPIIPIHGPASVYLAYKADGSPIAREFTTGRAPVTLTVDQKDAAQIESTSRFVDEITASPDGALAAAFKPLLAQPKAAVLVNDFFKDHPPYKSCTFASYMMVILSRARAAGSSPNSASYKLSAICDYLGGTWPPGFPDITITNFTCSTVNDTLLINGDVDFSSISFDPASTPVIRSVLPSTANATFTFHHGFDLGALGTRIELDLPEMTLVPGLTLRNPVVSLDINPLFKFVVFGAKATMPFSLFGSTFNANLSLTIDNAEASIGITIDGDHGSLLTPPVMKGVHFDEFGVGIGVFFEPKGYVVGVEGKFHIGDGGVVALDDNTVVVVCRMEGDIPDPLYISFYVPKMQLSDVITMFTNSSVDIGLPLTVSGLSYRWSKNPMDVVVLPDGSLSNMGYGFSGSLDLFGLSFYGDCNVDLTGIDANLAAAPVSLGPLRLAGNGGGVSLKVDANGNPIRNNQLATTKELRNAIANATTRQIVAPGGPSLKITTSGSPYVTLGANVSIFDAVSNSVTATVASDGITWEQDLNAGLQSRMRCKLANFHDFTGQFAYGLDLSIPLPSIAGFSLGSIPLKAMFDGTLGIKATESDITITLGGGFDFEGLSLSIGPFPIEVHTGKFSELIAAVGQYILDHAGDLFATIIGDAGKWAMLVFKGLITGVTAVADGLKTAYGKTAEEVAGIMKEAGYGIEAVGAALRDAFSSAVGEAEEVAKALKDAGYALADISKTMSSVLGYPADAINSALQGAGFAANEVEEAFKSVGGTLGDFAHSTWDKVADFFGGGC